MMETSYLASSDLIIICLFVCLFVYLFLMDWYCISNYNAELSLVIPYL